MRGVSAAPKVVVVAVVAALPTFTRPSPLTLSRRHNGDLKMQRKN